MSLRIDKEYWFYFVSYSKSFKSTFKGIENWYAKRTCFWLFILVQFGMISIGIFSAFHFRWSFRLIFVPDRAYLGSTSILPPDFSSTSLDGSGCSEESTRSSNLILGTILSFWIQIVRSKFRISDSTLFDSEQCGQEPSPRRTTSTKLTWK